LSKVDAATLASAISDVMGNQALKIDANEANRIVQNYMQAQQSKKYEKTIAEGKPFWTTTPNARESPPCPAASNTRS
jgi:hypothetical protein